jgi:hypothetical protein
MAILVGTLCDVGPRSGSLPATVRGRFRGFDAVRPPELIRLTAVCAIALCYVKAVRQLSTLRCIAAKCRLQQAS